MQSIEHKKISIVIPVYNGERNIKPVFEKIKNAMKNFEYEVVYVDDGSRDNSFEELKKIKETEKNIKIIKLKKNYGQHPALYIGVKNSSGDIIITFDNDLEIDPLAIPEFIESVKKGNDLVSGRRERRNIKFIRKIFSFLFNFFLSFLAGVRIHDCGCPLKGFNRKIAKEIIKYGDIPSIFPYIKKYRFSEIRIKTSPVKNSSYNFFKLLKLAIYSTKKFFLREKNITEPEIEIIL